MITDFDAARKAGLSALSAARWARYVAMHDGNTPITLEQAVEQKQAALRG